MDQARAAAHDVRPLAADRRHAADPSSGDRSLGILRSSLGGGVVAALDRGRGRHRAADRGVAARRLADAKPAACSSARARKPTSVLRSVATRCLPPATHATGRLIEDQLNQAMQGHVNLPYRIDLLDDGGVEIKVQLASGGADRRCTAKSAVQLYHLHLRHVDGRVVAGAVGGCDCFPAQSSEVAAPFGGSGRQLWQGPPRSILQGRRGCRGPPRGHRIHDYARSFCSAKFGNVRRCWPACLTICARR